MFDQQHLPDPAALPLFTTTTARPVTPARPAPNGAGTTPLTNHTVPPPSPAGQAGTGAPAHRTAAASDGIDWALVAAFRSQASNQLTRALGEDRDRLDRPAQQELGRAIIHELLAAAAAEHVAEGRPAWSLPEQDALAAAVFAALFGLGRLQPLVDDERVENIMITGCDRVTLELDDGTLIPGPPVADSDQELIDFLVFLASRSEVNARPFSPAIPKLHMRLDGGARLAACAWVVPRPSVVIRRNRLRKVRLTDLVERDTLSKAQASFLSAAVAARMSVVVSGPQGVGKALALDTPVPTPHGWTTMGALNAGDQVFTEDGTPCTVLDAHPYQHGRRCFQVEFDDGTTVTADADHLWRVTRRSHREAALPRNRAKWRDEPIYGANEQERARLWDLVDSAGAEPDRQVTVPELASEIGQVHRSTIHMVAQQLPPGGHTYVCWVCHNGRRGGRPMLTYSRQALLKAVATVRDTPLRRRPRLPQSVVLTTQQLVDSPLWAHQNKSWRTHDFAIAMTEPVQYPSTAQPLDPYVLGIWLGDGASSQARITTADPPVLAELEKAGYPCTKIPSKTNHYDYRVGGNLHMKLRVAGLLGDKHIPATYLRSSVQQRLALLQGLMDSDGTASKAGVCSFTSTLQLLAEQTYELVCSLGYKARMSTKPVRWRNAITGTAWTVLWTTLDPMFRMPRKAERQGRSRGGPRQRYIVAVREVASTPVRCITVDAPSSLFLVTKAFIATHNTTLTRALCAEIPAHESIGTFETEYELHLHELPEQHPIVHAWEARPGSGERGPDGRQAGEFTLAEALEDSFRFNLARQIVGEVRGKESWAMIKAMESGAGSLSTTHARDGAAAFRKLVTCAMEAGQHVDRELATSKLAEAIDVIVHMHLETTPLPDGTARRFRWVSEILLIEPSDEAKGYQTTTVFRPAPAGPGVADTIPDHVARVLVPFGFDYPAFLAEAQLHRRAS